MSAEVFVVFKVCFQNALQRRFIEDHYASKYVKAIPKANGLLLGGSHASSDAATQQVDAKCENLDLHPGMRPERRAQHEK
jgi:hypothetical protein